MMPENWWAESWESIEDSEMDRLIEIRAKSIDWKNKDVDEIVAKFGAAAKRLFVNDDQSRKIIRQLLALGRSHAATHFCNDAEYVSKVYSADPWGRIRPTPICIAGLSGVGKSELLDAFSRLIHTRTKQISVGQIQNIVVAGVWTATLSKARGMKDLLSSFLAQTELCDNVTSLKSESQINGQTRSRDLSNLKQLTATRSYRDGICVIGVDEFQFASKGDSNSWVTALLLDLMTLGPLLVYLCNFGLIHKLTRRPQEDRRRLLGEVIYVEPFKECNSDWRRYLEELMFLLPGVWAFEARDVESEMLSWSFGIRDYCVSLLKLALKSSLGDSQRIPVTKGALRLAFLSAEYADKRLSVETLKGGMYSLRKRPDLYSPLLKRDSNEIVSHEASGSEVAVQSVERQSYEGPEPSKNVPAALAIAAYEKKITAEMMTEQLPLSVQKKLEADAKSGKRVQRATIHNISKKRSASNLDELLANMDKYER